MIAPYKITSHVLGEIPNRSSKEILNIRGSPTLLGMTHRRAYLEVAPKIILHKKGSPHKRLTRGTPKYALP